MLGRVRWVGRLRIPDRKIDRLSWCCNPCKKRDPWKILGFNSVGLMVRIRLLFAAHPGYVCS